MIEVYDEKVLVRLMATGNYPADLCSFLKQRLKELRYALLDAGMEAYEVTTLREFGYPVLIEPNDDLFDMEKIGLNKCDGGFFGCIPEVIEKLNFSNSSFYSVSVAYNNSFMLEFLLPGAFIIRKYPEFYWFINRWGYNQRFIDFRSRNPSKVA
ncbi:MAG: hypothetical protein ACQETH_17630 [Candidatus Rifleibacteriota bacterium]